MDEETQSHIFEPFYTTKEPDQGTGLGLAQVYGIVKQHHGHVEVKSARGEGTTFTIYLPLIHEDAAASSAPGGEPARAGAGETILVVEDAEEYREAIRDGLETLNYRVLTASGGREALDVVASQAVDLVLTDLVMPGMGGRELAEALREEASLVPSVAMTGYALDSDPESLKAYGFRDVIFKPFSIEDLSRVLRTTLDGGP
jgi:CheY-like chemotaxis protein